MRALAISALMACLAVATVGAAPSSGRDGDAAFKRAHAAAVKYRTQRDRLQELLTRRVREARGLRRTLLRKSSSLEALRLAAIAYHVDFHLMYRIASCESTGPNDFSGPVSERTLYARAKNPTSTASGLAQFLTSTWAATPYAGEDIFSGYANALALANEISHHNENWQWAASRSCWG